MIGVGDWVATPDMIANVLKVLRSGRLTYGPYSRLFESKFSELHNNYFGVLSNSGTSSLLVALQTLKNYHGWSDWDEVLVPASTFVATVNIVKQSGLTPVLVDVDPEHYLIDVTTALSITSKTKAIIPVHLFGQPVNVTSFAKAYNLKVLEDSCECCGVGGTGYGDIACYSFYVAHILTTGVGGMSITSSPAYATMMRSLVNHGRDNVYISMDDGRDRLEEVIGKRFSFQYIGHSFRVTEMESAIGVAQLDSLAESIMTRRANAFHLSAELEELAGYMQLPKELVQGQHAYMMYPIVMPSAESKQSLCLYLEQHGVETRDALPLVTQPVYHISNPAIKYPNAYRLATCGFYVGCHQHLDFTAMGYIALKIKEWYHGSHQ